MTRLRGCPWTLRLAAIGTPVVLFAPALSYAPTKPYIESIALVVILFVFVLAGSRIAWVLATALIAIAVLGTLVNGISWEAAARLLLLILLLLPPSRKFVWRRDARARVSTPGA
jgi:hypothetical protein